MDAGILYLKSRICVNEVRDHKKNIFPILGPLGFQQKCDSRKMLFFWSNEQSGANKTSMVIIIMNNAKQKVGVYFYGFDYEFCGR